MAVHSSLKFHVIPISLKLTLTLTSKSIHAAERNFFGQIFISIYNVTFPIFFEIHTLN